MVRTHPWEISDAFWAEVEPLIPTKEECRDKNGEYKRKSGGGRKRKEDDRSCFAAMVYVLRTGTIGNALPREKFGGLGSSALHYRFQLWERGGLFERIWEAGLNKFDELEGIDWEWQSADGCPIKAPLTTESAGANSTDRGKNGVENQRLRGGSRCPALHRRLRGESA
ncbi:MAG: transposase [Planctomycetia bacterium]|nr:transposase [Planctomycetia bacterium]